MYQVFINLVNHAALLPRPRLRLGQLLLARFRLVGVRVGLLVVLGVPLDDRIEVQLVH